jgi:hypothetical protein
MTTLRHTWDEKAVRAECKEAAKGSEEWFATQNLPETERGQEFYDLCLTEFDVEKHLLATDCFSSREVLVEELGRLLTEPVMPSSLPPYHMDKYLAFQKTYIKVKIHNLTLEQRPPEKSWFHRFFGYE